MSITELGNNLESVWVKTSHYIAGWYWQPNGTGEHFQQF